MIRPGILGTVAALGLAGCTGGDGPSLIVATTWPPAARAEIEADFRRGGGSIAWVEVGPADPAGALLEGRAWDRPDLFLGAPESSLIRLADAGRLAPIDPADPADPAPFRPVRRPDPGALGPRPAPTASFADPRDDPATLAEAKAVLAASGWADGYRSLARRAALARPAPGRTPRAASALADGANRAGGPSEAVALVRDGPRIDEARRFWKVLEARNLVGAAALGTLEAARADGLLGDLLGAALVDAHGELRAAEVALRRSTRPEALGSAFGDRPPWPPASVAKLQAGPADAPLVEALAEQLAADPEAKAWLLASWAAPKRPVDGPVLAELAGALDGRLAREPRFRAWLRAEWAAWHRQLYRRVARVAGGYVPS